MLLFGPVIFPLGHIGQHLFGLILISHLCKVTVMPLDADIPGSGFVGVFRGLLHKSRVPDTGPDNDGLILLHIRAFTYHKLRQFVIHLFCNQIINPPYIQFMISVFRTEIHTFSFSLYTNRHLRVTPKMNQASDFLVHLNRASDFWFT